MRNGWVQAGVVVAVGVGLLVGAVAPAGASGRRSAALPVVTVSGATGHAVSRGFVGLALEASSANSPILDTDQSNLPFFLGELGPANFRIGGQTSDLSVAWQPDPSQPLPPWATSTITPASLAVVARLARTTGWSVDLGVDLLHDDPASAANEVATARYILGTSLHDVEIGNEPEFYSEFTSPWSFDQYTSELTAYESAIRSADPSVSFAGPDLYFTSWLTQFAANRGVRVRALSELAQHYYPLFDCNNAVVTAADLLSQASITSEDQTVAAAAKVAKKAALPVVLDELNSVSCGSSSPVIHQFASALWSVRALLEAASKGVASVNVQMNPGNCQSYSPLCVPDPAAPGTLQAQPIFYGMLLVDALQGGTFLTTKNASRAKLPVGVSTYAVRLPDGNDAVVVDNTSSQPVTSFTISVDPSARVVAASTLQAPSLTATDGVSLTTTATDEAPTGLAVPADSATVFTVAP